VFDLGNTLVKYDYGLPEEIFQKVLFSLGITRSLFDIKKAFSIAEKDAEDINLPSLSGKIECEDFWFQWNCLVLKHLQVEENEEIPRTIYSKWMDFVDCTLYPEVREVLLKLQRRGIKVGLISNAYEEEISLVLEKAKLENATFDTIVGVDTVQCMKPHPDIFKCALRKLSVWPEEAMFVGDQLEADYKGAKKVGIYALLIDRTGKQKQGNMRTIKNLNEILSQLDQVSSTSHKNRIVLE
jgi:2-haloalkanoic acid dehalogenase type II